jgi:hypothetical protein
MSGKYDSIRTLYVGVSQKIPCGVLLVVFSSACGWLSMEIRVVAFQDCQIKANARSKVLNPNNFVPPAMVFAFWRCELEEVDTTKIKFYSYTSCTSYRQDDLSYIGTTLAFVFR